MVIIRRLLLLGALALRVKPVAPGSRLVDAGGSFLTDQNGNKLTG